MIVSGGQRPIRVAGRSAGVARLRARRGGLLVLKNGPLCLAVYGGRDLAGLPSADSRAKGVDQFESRGGWRVVLKESVKLSLIRAKFLTSPISSPLSSSTLLLSARDIPGWATPSKKIRYAYERPLTMAGALADNRGVDIG